MKKFLKKIKEYIIMLCIILTKILNGEDDVQK